MIPRIGKKRLDKVRKVDVQNMVDDIYTQAQQAGRSGAATARKARAALRTALQDAVDLEVLLRNPCVGVKVPAEQGKPIEIWSDDQHRRFLDVAQRHRLYPILYTALTSGMREMELCGLKWTDLEVLEPDEAGGEVLLRIHIRRSLVRVPARYADTPSVARLEHVCGAFYFDEPKTKRSKDSVLVASDTLSVLNAQRAALELSRGRLGARWQEYDLVFPASNGVPQNPRNLLRDYKSVIKEAGVPELSFHDLRDTHASRLLAAGVDIGVVSERLRHSRKSTTLDKYAHVMDDQRKRAAVAMRDLMGK